MQSPTGGNIAVPATETSTTLFAQQEAALNGNTGALNSLTGGIESLRNIISTLQTSFETVNTNQTNQNANQNTGGQPGVQTTTNAPVTLVVNAESDTDVGMAVEKAILKAIPEIVKRVQAADGKKIPPTVPKKITTE